VSRRPAHRRRPSLRGMRDGIGDLASGVAVRFSSLCLDAQGRLRDYAIWDTGARGALLVDLALAARLVQTEDSVTVDERPTGFPPADRLLAAIAVEPERDLDWWLDHGGVGVPDLAEANVAAGRWTVGRRLLARRYAETDPATAAADRVLDPRRPDPDWTRETAAVMAVALATGALEPPPDPPDETLLALTASVRWIVEAVVDHLTWAHARNRTLRATD
jgi:Golgi phosphoprotein 3 (GPP34)